MSNDQQETTASYYVARHPDCFRPGVPALILGIAMADKNLCYHVRYRDAVEDYAPIENEDFVGRGGAGTFYDILRPDAVPAEYRHPLHVERSVASKYLGGLLFTNDPPTIEEVIKFLQWFTPHQKVRAYEGEGGSQIIVEES